MFADVLIKIIYFLIKTSFIQSNEKFGSVNFVQFLQTILFLEFIIYLPFYAIFSFLYVKLFNESRILNFKKGIASHIMAMLFISMMTVLVLILYYWIIADWPNSVLDFVDLNDELLINSSAIGLLTPFFLKPLLRSND